MDNVVGIDGTLFDLVEDRQYAGFVVTREDAGDQIHCGLVPGGGAESAGCLAKDVMVRGGLVVDDGALSEFVVPRPFGSFLEEKVIVVFLEGAGC